MAASGSAVAQRTPSFKIELLTTAEDANKSLRLIRDGMSIGFDAEWTADNAPGAKQKTRGERNAEKRQQTSTAAHFAVTWEVVKLRVLQIYWGNGIVYVIDLPAMKEIPQELERVCASRAIVKAGTGIFCDAGRLWKDFRINLLSCVELGLASKLVYPEIMRPHAFYSELVGLAEIAEHVCGMKLDKNHRESDWSKTVLTSEQLEYAATDAYASFECYTRLQGEIDRCEYNIPRDWFTFDVVGNTRMKAGTDVKWTAECKWWSKELGVGFLARH
ncbi:ribonuclease H-like domain-containing protein [Mycena olivaceomarginata]|nr:ribonuclease H-like domain-containing protein [Mycena olivaceomarginata]KAJ7825405.1 ribonuclease H-like domain-containing protein [Mycena olivaceomarginata]KAJ7837747.1 ribonuclease H-like domain-containing protein [Mycena olivaceomarginata]